MRKIVRGKRNWTFWAAETIFIALFVIVTVIRGFSNLFQWPCIHLQHCFIRFFHLFRFDVFLIELRFLFLFYHYWNPFLDLESHPFLSVDPFDTVPTRLVSKHGFLVFLLSHGSCICQEYAVLKLSFRENFIDRICVKSLCPYKSDEVQVATITHSRRLDKLLIWFVSSFVLLVKTSMSKFRF